MDSLPQGYGGDSGRSQLRDPALVGDTIFVC